MAIKRRRSSKSFNGGAVLTWGGAVFALGVLIAGGLGLMRMRATEEGRDQATLCANKNPAQITAFLFDSSDPLTDLQQIKIRQALAQIVQDVPKGMRVDVYMATAEAGQLARPLFRKCNPVGEDGAGGWNENRDRALERQRTLFLEPLDKAFGLALRAQPRPTSPILETIAAISVQSFGRNSTRNSGEKTRNLVIISDFLQNSSILTQYRPYESVTEFSNNEGWIHTLSSLHNASIDMLYVSRPKVKHIQNQVHKNWWCEYFNARSAAQCNVEQL